MLDPEYLKNITSDLEDYWYDLETNILKDIAERIKLNKNKLTSTASYQIVIAKELEISDEKISSYLAKALDITLEDASKIIKEASYKSVESDNEIFEEAYRKGFINNFSYDKDSFKSIIENGIILSSNDISNLCNTTAQTARKKLLECLNSAYMMSESGAFGYDVIVDTVVSKLARDGLEWIDYDSGTHRRLDSVIRAAVRTAANQTAAKCQEKNMDDLECNLVETSAHMGARPSHAEWQGQIFYRNKPYKDYSNFYDATGYGTAGGLCGVNCRHSYFPFFEGISTPSFEKIDTEENKQLYELQQKQRYNERKIREWKRKRDVKEAAGLDATKEKAKVREWNKRNKKLILSDSRLKRNYGREKSYGSHKGNKLKEFYATDDKNVKIKVRKGETNLTKHQYESAIVYDQKGNVILKKDGSQHEVEFTEKELHLMKDAVVTHNHPKDTTFSPDDIYMLINNNIQEVRATTSKGTFVLRRNENIHLMPPKEEFVKEHYSLYIKYRDVYMNKHPKWENDVGRMDRVVQNNVMNYLARKYGFDYNFVE